MHVGDIMAARELPALRGALVRVPHPNQIVHLQFRRYAGCPICSVHLRDFAARYDELIEAGVRDVAVFHSSREDLLQYKANLPFDVVPDPARELYRQFGVDRGAKAVLHPSAWLAAIRGWSRDLPLRAGVGGHLGLPADFLIAPDGRVLACKYGTHANDDWSVDTVIALARSCASESH